MRTSFMRAWLAAAVLAMACSADRVVDPGSAGDPHLRYGQPGGGGTEVDEGFGNNLSVPVVFAEGYGITGLQVTTDNLLSTGLRTPGTATYATLPDYIVDPNAATVTLPSGATGYCQKTAHTWMAQWTAGATSAEADWGDNLTSQQFTSTSVIRVEMGLFAPGTMTGYNMELYSGSRRTELQCTDLVEESYQPTVYSVAPRLRIWKVAADQAAPTDDPLIDLSVDEAFGQDGPGYYRAEINVAGKLIYGYNWYVKQLPISDKKGWYLISFAFEDATVSGTPVSNGVTLTAVRDAKAQLTSGTETRIWVEVKDSRDKGGNKPPKPAQ